MSEPVAGPSSGIVKPRKVKSKWEEMDDDETDERVRPIKKKSKKVKTFSTSIHASTPGTSIGGTDSGGSTPKHGASGLGVRGAAIGKLSSRHPTLQGCRSVYSYERLNHIEEGSYGVVSRARDRETGDIVALKKLKMDQEKNGFPITSLREIRTLMMVGHHENIVRVREIVVGDTLTQSVPAYNRPSELLISLLAQAEFL